MKAIIAITTVIWTVLGMNCLMAQDVTFEYDSNGNRVERVIPFSDKEQDKNKGEENYKDDQIQEVYIESFGKNSVNIYPNPTKGKFLVKFKGNYKEMDGSVTITSQTGTVVYRKNKVKPVLKFDIQSLQPGNYFLTIILNNQNVTWKIVKQ